MLEASDLEGAIVEPELTALDRCDRCGAQAYLRVQMPETGFELLFCGHDAEKARSSLEELAAQGASLHDELGKLSRRPIASSVV